MGEDRMALSQRERDRLPELHFGEQGSCAKTAAAQRLGMSDRRVRRLLRRVKVVGDRGVIHCLRGPPFEPTPARPGEGAALAILSKWIRAGSGPPWPLNISSAERFTSATRRCASGWLSLGPSASAAAAGEDAPHLARAASSLGELVLMDTSDRFCLEQWGTCGRWRPSAPRSHSTGRSAGISDRVCA